MLKLDLINEIPYSGSLASPTIACTRKFNLFAKQLDQHNNQLGSCLVRLGIFIASSTVRTDKDVISMAR